MSQKCSESTRIPVPFLINGATILVQLMSQHDIIYIHFSFKDNIVNCGISFDISYKAKDLID